MQESELVPTTLHFDMQVAKLRFWCPWLSLMCCFAAPSLRTPTRAIPQGGPLFLNSHEKNPPCGVSERKNMSLVAVNSAEKSFLMILLGPVFLEPHKLPGQMSVESPSHQSVAGPSHAVDFTQGFRSPWGARSLTVPGAVRNRLFLWEVKPCKRKMNVPTLHVPGEAWRPSLNSSCLIIRC